MTDETAGKTSVQFLVANQAPVASGVPLFRILDGDGPSPLDLSSLVLSDADGDPLTLTVSTNFGGTLDAEAGDGVGVAGAGTDTLVLSGSAEALTAYLNGVERITFTPASEAEDDFVLDDVSLILDDGMNPPVDLGTVSLERDFEELDLVVTTAADTVDAGDGVTSLREAVEAANTAEMGGIITFSPELAGETLVLEGGTLTLTGLVSIDGDTDGDGSGDITIDGNGDQIFQIAADSAVVELLGLTLTGGLAGDGSAIEVGAPAAPTDPFLELELGSGGDEAPETFPSLLILTNSQIVGNQSHSGGAVMIHQDAIALMSGVTFAGNTLSGEAEGLAGTPTLRNDGLLLGADLTFSGTDTLESLATAFLNGAGAEAYLVNTTISGLAAQYGIIGNAGALTLLNATITGNTVETRPDGESGIVYQFPDGEIEGAAPVTSIGNSIILGNPLLADPVIEAPVATSGPPALEDLAVLSAPELGSPTFIDLGGNLFSGTVSDVFAVVTEGRAELADHGGPVETIRIREGGPAEDAGLLENVVSEAFVNFDFDGDGVISAETIETDAAGGLRIVGESVDAGAYEIQAPEPVEPTEPSEPAEPSEPSEPTEPTAPEPETITGSAGNDDLDGTGGDDQIEGLGGDDELEGRAGDDALDGGPGNDSLRGGGGNDVLRGGNGSDTLFGGPADDVIGGDGGDDSIVGGIGDDELNGGGGSDRIASGGGNDSVVGGVGDDLIFGGAGDDSIDGGSGNDDIYGGAGRDSLAGGTQDDRLFAQSGNDFVEGGEGRDELYGAAGDDTLFGDEGRDLLFGGIGDDILMGGDDNDVLRGQGGDDLVLGEAGNDRLFGARGNDTLDGGIGNDILLGGAGRDTLLGGDGDDELRGQGGDDLILGDRGDDTLFGGGGADEMVAQLGSDTMNGGAGNDRLTLLQGSHTATGGGGNDTFAINATGVGRHTVTDFASGDLIELDGFDFTDLAAARAAFSQAGTDTVFMSGDVSVTFVDTTLSDVRAAVSLDAVGLASPALDTGGEIEATSVIEPEWYDDLVI